MAGRPEWMVEEGQRPDPSSCPFDLLGALDAVVALRCEVPEDAFTAGVLGTERAGSGVLISDSGLLVTVGYLVTEAETVWITANDGTAVPGHVLGYDFITGLGLVQALGRLPGVPLPIGAAAALEVGDRVIAAGHGGRAGALDARVTARKEFAGYWEYLLDEAVFTAPAHPHWGGGALIAMDGTLCGIGSLLIQEGEGQSRESQGNMFVPVELLETVQGELMRHGQRVGPGRPWLGLYSFDTPAGPVVAGLADGGPAEMAGMAAGDVILAVGGNRVHSLAEMYRRIWALGPAGIAVPLTVLRDGNVIRADLDSVDRHALLRRPQMH